MKTTQITIILFVLISLFTYSSCSKDGEENPIPGTPDNGKITAKIDGNRFESEYTATTLLDSILNIPYVYITGYDNSSQLTASEAIAIGIVSNPGPITTGNYTQSNEDCDITQTQRNVCASQSSDYAPNFLSADISVERNWV